MSNIPICNFISLCHLFLQISIQDCLWFLYNDSGFSESCPLFFWTCIRIALNGFFTTMQNFSRMHIGTLLVPYPLPSSKTTSIFLGVCYTNTTAPPYHYLTKCVKATTIGYHRLCSLWTKKISHHPRNWEIQYQYQEMEEPLLDSHIFIFSLYPQMAEVAKEASVTCFKWTLSPAYNLGTQKLTWQQYLWNYCDPKNSRKYFIYLYNFILSFIWKDMGINNLGKG